MWGATDQKDAQGNPVPVPWAFSFELALMDETGWTWDELMSTPYPVVQIKAAQMAARNKAVKLKAVLDAAKK